MAADNCGETLAVERACGAWGCMTRPVYLLSCTCAEG